MGARVAFGGGGGHVLCMSSATRQGFALEGEEVYLLFFLVREVLKEEGEEKKCSSVMGTDESEEGSMVGM